jgi:hypothetical protein
MRSARASTARGNLIGIEIRRLKASAELDPAFRNMKASLWYRAAEMFSHGPERKPFHVAKK